MKKVVSIIILGLLMVMIFSAAAHAVTPSVSLGGTLYFRAEDSSATDSGIDDKSWVGYYELVLKGTKKFGDNAEGYLALETQSYTPVSGGSNRYGPFQWRIKEYGYNYKISDAIGIGMNYSVGGFTLSDGTLASNWDWLHVHTFDNNPNSKPVLRVFGTPMTEFSYNTYIDLETMEYIIKGEYKADTLKLGAGYTNATALVNADRTFNVYADIKPVENVRIYLDYLSDGKYIVDASANFDPFTVTLLSSNEDMVQNSYHTIHAADTTNIGLKYALDESSYLKGGVVYKQDTSELGSVYVQYGFDKLTVGLSYDLINEQTSLSGKYNIDGSNSIEASINLDTSNWWIAFAVSMW